jgi:hypothetical protein
MRLSHATAVALLLAAPSLLRAQVNFTDDFDPSGVDTAIWHKWPEAGADESLWTSNAQNYTPGGMYSAMAIEADPFGYVGYADFGSTADPIYAEVWVFDTLDDDGMNVDRPVSCMLALIGAAASPPDYTDYLQLGVVAWYTHGLSHNYAIRTKYRDLHGGGFIDTGVARKPGWTKLAIAAESPANGGQVRFYIDDRLVGMSRRVGVNLQYIRLGVNFKSYDYFWYDDVVVSSVLPPDVPRFDADGDGDVDSGDYGAFQACWTGPGNGPFDISKCWRMDIDENGDVDTADLDGFNRCMSGPAVVADPACDDGPLPP